MGRPPDARVDNHGHESSSRAILGEDSAAVFLGQFFRCEEHDTIREDGTIFRA